MKKDERMTSNIINPSAAQRTKRRRMGRLIFGPGDFEFFSPDHSTHCHPVGTKPSETGETKG
jgi:hypothetical protein